MTAKKRVVFTFDERSLIPWEQAEPLLAQLHRHERHAGSIVFLRPSEHIVLIQPPTAMNPDEKKLAEKLLKEATEEPDKQTRWALIRAYMDLVAAARDRVYMETLPHAEGREVVLPSRVPAQPQS